MSSVFAVLFLFSIVCLIVGLIRPSLFTKIFKSKTNRAWVGLSNGGLVVLFFALTAITAPPIKQNTTVSKSTYSYPVQTLAAAGATTITKINNMPAGTEYQIYPSTKWVAQPNDQYSPLSPIPPQTALLPGTPNSLVTFKATAWDQTSLVSRCYSTWAKPTPTGGQNCGLDVLDGSAGQCTFWALFNYNSPNIYKMTASYSLDAHLYYSFAQSHGIPTSQTPTVGAMVSWAYTPNLYSQVGHVATVVAVNSNKNTFVITEMDSEYTPWRIDYRVVSDKPGGVGYGNLEGFILP